jgi:hypothetical protein
MLPAERHRGQDALVEGFEIRRALLRPDEKASSVISTDQLVIWIARLGRGHRWPINDLYESVGK